MTDTPRLVGDPQDDVRYYNKLDMIPRASGDVGSIGQLFPPPAPAASSISTTVEGLKISLADAFDGVADAIEISEIANDDSYYTHTNLPRGSIELNQAGKVFAMTSTDPLERWFEQASAQHDHNNYLAFLGAGPVHCQQSGQDVDFTAD